MQPERTGRTRVYTYFIQAVHGGPVKIGVAGDVPDRLSDLQCANPDELRIVGSVVGNGEALFHKMWRGERIRREWFHPAESMREWAPGLRLDDERPHLDQLDVEQRAYCEGWDRAMEHVAAAVPACRDAVFTIAEDHRLAWQLKTRFGQSFEKTVPSSFPREIPGGDQRAA